MRLITTEQVDLNLAATDRREAIASMSDLLVSTGAVTDVDGFLEDVHRRERQLATGLPGGVAIPHARSPHVSLPAVAFGRSATGIDWGASDGPATMVFLIAAPHGASTDHLAILAMLARRLTHKEFREQLTELDSGEAVADLIENALSRS